MKEFSVMQPEGPSQLSTRACHWLLSWANSIQSTPS